MPQTNHLVVQDGTLHNQEANLFDIKQLDELHRLEEIGRSEDVLDLIARARDHGHIELLAKISVDKFQYIINPRILNQIYVYKEERYHRKPSLDLETLIKLDVETIESLSELGDKIISDPKSKEARKYGRISFCDVINYYKENPDNVTKYYFQKQVDFINYSVSEMSDLVEEYLKADRDNPHKNVVACALVHSAEGGKTKSLEAIFNNYNDLMQLPKRIIISSFKFAVQSSEVKTVEAFFNSKIASQLGFLTKICALFSLVGVNYHKDKEVRNYLLKNLF